MMRGRATVPWHNHVSTWVVALVICLVCAASVRVPPPVDVAMVERAVAGAEWLASRAGSSSKRVERAAEEDDLTTWLLIAGGADDSAGYAAFGAYLAGAGYEDSDSAVQRWLNEFPRVLTAHEAVNWAARSGQTLRPTGEIEDELNALPMVALDEAGEAERERLEDELSLAATPQAARDVASAAAERLETLAALAKAGAEQ